MATLAERAKQAKIAADLEKERERLEQEERNRVWEAEAPRRAKLWFERDWPKEEKEILEAARTKHSYSWAFSQWNRTQDLSTEDKIFVDLVCEAASGMRVSVVTEYWPGCNSNDIDGPQGPTEGTYAHVIHFEWD